MITLLRNDQRRHVRRGKRDVWHSFFAEDHPGQLASGFGSLIAFDEMQLPPGVSTELRRCNEAETVTYVYKGALSQEDSLGNSGVIHAGEFQCMSTGPRILHKGTNASRFHWAHVFRISLRPSEVGLDRAHEQKRFTVAQRHNVLCVVASPDERKGSLRVHQDALICSSIVDPGYHLFHELLPGRSAWLHVLCGEAAIDDVVLTQGDGAGVVDEPSVSLTVQESAELMMVEVGSLPGSFGSGVVP